jgi:hypothetical protein
MKTQTAVLLNGDNHPPLRPRDPEDLFVHWYKNSNDEIECFVALRRDTGDKFRGQKFQYDKGASNWEIESQFSKDFDSAFKNLEKAMGMSEAEPGMNGVDRLRCNRVISTTRLFKEACYALRIFLYYKDYLLPNEKIRSNSNAVVRALG